MVKYEASESRQIIKYGKEEIEILEAYEAGKMKLSTPSMEEIEAIKSAAESTITQDKGAPHLPCRLK